MFSKIYLVFLVPLLFLFLAVKTLPDYGVNWDEAQHFNRGQAYWYYFLTGKTNYLDLPKHNTLDESVNFKDVRGRYAKIYLEAKRSDKNDTGYRRSYYQSDIFDFGYFKNKDSGHPPANGVLAAATNYFFYQKWDITGDLYAYHLFEVFTAFLIVLGVSILAYRLYGVFPAIVAGTSLSLYPLFFSESHFNIKDPVLSSFFGITIILFYFGITAKKKLLIIVSAIFAGLALGTKFNALFLPLIVLPWLIFYWWKVEKFGINKALIVVLTGYPIVALGVFFLLWPYLWFNGWEGFYGIFRYYSSEGMGSNSDLANFIFGGFNLFPAFWIIVTTPLPILLFFTIGLYWIINNFIRKKDHTGLLFLLWLAVPILRVSIPNAVIYGGVRHIMEFIPALALIAGAGSYFLLSTKSKSFSIFFKLMILAGFAFVVYEMVSIHPNQNVYFNQLIGGLKGAYEKEIPYAGNSFGNAYQQGIAWLNKNAEPQAKLGLPIGGTVNLPRENLRTDINLGNDNFSAFLQQGEYEMEMSHNGVPKELFAYSYLDNFLDPVYEVKVDDVTLLKVWKNDPAHARNNFGEEISFKEGKLKLEGNVLIIDMESDIYLTRLYINHNKKDCNLNRLGYVSTSLDGFTWSQQSDPISYPQMSESKINPNGHDFFFLFAGKKARFIKVSIDGEKPCLLSKPEIEIKGFNYY